MPKEEYLPYGKENVGKAIWECLKKMYKESKPSADIEKIAKSGEGKMKNFFMAYWLSSRREEEIVDEVCKEFKITGWRKQQVTNTVWMGSAPNSCKETWRKERLDYEIRLNKFFKSKSQEAKGK